MKKNLKVATILDKFSYDCFKYECNLIYLNPSNWYETILKEKPDLLLVESAWEGIDGTWKNQIGSINKNKYTLLKNIVITCKNFQIPTVFWNKEDPCYFDYFISTAKLFDYVFTTDENCISKYIKILKHNNVYCLPFAAQPNIHNPINKDFRKIGKVAFAGSWYNNLNVRKENMDIVLKPALKHGLHIYDRKYNYNKNNNYKFPDIYKPFIKGFIPYEEMVETYKKYNIFLNVNSVNNSASMVSRRVFELLACGTNIISSYSIALQNYFPKIVKLSTSQEDTLKHLQTLLSNKDIRDKLSLIGQREVFNKHTYSHRFKTISYITGLKTENLDNNGVSIINCTNRPEYIDNLFSNFERQNYNPKELIIILNNNSMNLNFWKEKSALYPNVKVFQLDENKSLGECLNFGVSQSNFDYVAKFDDDDYYAENYLIDSMNAFKYTNADIIGKNSYYSYLKNDNTFLLTFPNKENRYSNFVSGATLVMKKNIFSHVNFPQRSSGEDTEFLKRCILKNIKIYSIDRFNYLCIRHMSENNHTWKIKNSDFMKLCKFIAYTNKHIEHITI